MINFHASFSYENSPVPLFAQAQAHSAILGLKDDNTPLESIMLLLYGLYEQTQVLQNVHNQERVQLLNHRLEARQEKYLALIETSLQKQLDLLRHKELASLGSALQKTLVAAMSVMTVSSAIANGGVFLPALAVTAALFTAADAIISIIDYAQWWKGTLSEDTIAQKMESTFTEVLAKYDSISYPTLVNYISTMRTLLMASVLIATNTFTQPTFRQLLTTSSSIPPIIESAYAVKIAQTEFELSQMTAEQKIIQVLQGRLKQTLNMLHKGIRTQYQALEDLITSTAEALEQQSITSRRIIQNII